MARYKKTNCNGKWAIAGAGRGVARLSIWPKREQKQRKAKSGKAPNCTICEKRQTQCNAMKTIIII